MTDQGPPSSHGAFTSSIGGESAFPASSAANRMLPGSPVQLGATYDGAGVNFAVYSSRATRIDLCLYESSFDPRPRETLRLPERTGHVFHGYVPGLRPGVLYGYRAHGDYDPRRGLYFNPSKLLVDPYALAVDRDIDWSAPMTAHESEKTLAESREDNGGAAPKGVVVDRMFDWQGDRAPRTPMSDSVLYEVHVKGFSAMNRDVPAPIRGTYAGLASEASIRHFQRIGVTALELLPIHEIADERAIVARGLKNYWGYSTLSYFAPAGRYSSRGRHGEQVTDFKAMVRALHRANIEVILDVVYNHTGEGDHLGPMLNLRGLDNPTYYRLSPKDPSRYADFTGCGNSLDTRHPQALKLVLDSLRYWVEEMHVDGFRFDLASTLARGQNAYDPASAFLAAVHQDPALARVKIIAEPWDLGEGGYQVGAFPVRWSEWNGKYRDSVRRFWRGDPSIAAELGYRLTGSSDLYEGGGRSPSASVNFVTAHDGFTLRDLYTYEKKKNEANGENNRDGTDDNAGWNCGVEGETKDAAIVALRDRMVRTLLATLFVSQGVPMITAGDELGKTQRGNNNAYCQDNEVSWINWDLDAPAREILAFVERLARLRRDNAALRRARFFSGGRVRQSGVRDVVWFSPSGREMSADEWRAPDTRALGMFLGGGPLGWTLESGELATGHPLLILLNASRAAVRFALPPATSKTRARTTIKPEWSLVLDTARDLDEPHDSASPYALEAHALAVFEAKG